tara:strand:+ start:4139 stop:5350 length:1212 start_codon:yes stop_codon:yes gene_type:complete
MKDKILKTSCCIVGGGPAGLICGYLLALKGVDVIVLEKHNDFLRDFRGDTIHPSTLQLLRELGLLENFLKLPHDKIKQFVLEIGGKNNIIADFSKLKTACPYVALMPQWDFLNFISNNAQKLLKFNLLMNTEAVDLLYKDNHVSGVLAYSDEKYIKIFASLVIGADGRDSIVRKKSNLELIKLGAPMDVLWMRVSRLSTDPDQIMGKVHSGKMLVMINRGKYWQCAYIISKGSFEKIKKQGLDKFLDNLLEVAPFLKERIHELSCWSDIKILSVSVDRLKLWYKNNLLCIGDSAHAMSPIGGVGVNLAIQDAVATANILGDALTKNKDINFLLKKVQKRRSFPTKVTQKIQVIIQNKLINKALHSSKTLSLPWFMRFVLRWQFTRKLIAKKIGLGFRVEHINL